MANMSHMLPHRMRNIDPELIRSTVPRASIFGRIQGERRGSRKIPSNDICLSSSKAKRKIPHPCFHPSARSARRGLRQRVTMVFFLCPQVSHPGGASYSCLTPTSRPGLGYVAPSALLEWIGRERRHRRDRKGQVPHRFATKVVFFGVKGWEIIAVDFYMEVAKAEKSTTSFRERDGAPGDENVSSLPWFSPSLAAGHRIGGSDRLCPG
jgi:hypothetical protein